MPFQGSSIVGKPSSGEIGRMFDEGGEEEGEQAGKEIGEEGVKGDVYLGEEASGLAELRIVE